MPAAVTMVQELAATFSMASVDERIQGLRQAVPGKLVFTSSFGLEDQVITHFIAATGADIDIVTLDTGRMFPEVYDVWQQTQEKYALPIRGIHPSADAVEELIARQGINGFYQSVDQRHACCQVRKVEPLGRALEGAAAWITGLRGDASGNRGDMAPVSFDAARGLIKYNPLFDWSREDARGFAVRQDLPVNPLHAKGFVSVGCAPCTRAIAPGEPERSGRWWWEQDDARECGLHIDRDGRLVRTHA